MFVLSSGACTQVENLGPNASRETMKSSLLILGICIVYFLTHRKAVLETILLELLLPSINFVVQTLCDATVHFAAIGHEVLCSERSEPKHILLL